MRKAKYASQKFVFVGKIDPILGKEYCSRNEIHFMQWSVFLFASITQRMVATFCLSRAEMPKAFLTLIFITHSIFVSYTCILSRVVWLSP